MDEKISKLFLPLLEKLYNNEPAGEPFRQPVDPIKYGCYDYYLYVKHPIDLSTIRQKLVTNKYKDAWRFIADIELMFKNAYLFNKKGTPVYEFTNRLKKIWNSELTNVMQRLNYCCGNLHQFGPQPLFCHGTTPDKYCQIAIGVKYKIYQDSYSFCIPCFNRIETDYVSLQTLTCETTRMNLPTQPVKKSDFTDCTNDRWQYETFLQCTQCSRRIHQICDLYPTYEEEIKQCIQHEQIEQEQKEQCHVPPEFEAFTKAGEPITATLKTALQTLDDELLQFARNVEDFHDQSVPNSPNPDQIIEHENLDHFESAKDVPQHKDGSTSISRSSSAYTTASSSNIKNSVDKIAARLSSNKLGVENHVEEKQGELAVARVRDKFVCNHCYRKQRLGFNLRHRKFSARRLPHTRMSRYIETKVNEYIRENSPTAGEMTIRVLAAYRDKVDVKRGMRDYLNRCRDQDPSSHPNLEDYPDDFAFTTRAIFAWQEIDGVEVCVFGMHVQEYGEDCPEPNKQVVYLSYLDSVHFFRPKQFRTAVYHEILLSYFKYVKKLGFRRVFIWVCPSRKGDDYIFYRHPSEQKMPTLKRLSDWYVHLLDKGVVNGIVERHQNVYEYAMSEKWTSLLSMPYLSGDYWPGEFERLLKSMIESQKKYDQRMSQRPEPLDIDKPLDLSKSNSVASPECFDDDDQVSDASYKESNPKKRRRRSSATMGYTKKRNRNQNGKNCASLSVVEPMKRVGAPYLNTIDTLLSPEEELIKNLDRSLKRQREGFIVVRLSECDCSPHFESQRRKEEKTSSCDLMKGREPFLQLARQKNYEFSTLRRAKFSSLAMVRHLRESLKLEPICYECFSFDTSKRHFACNQCEDYYLCTSCHENTIHEHVMTLLPPSSPPDIDEFLLQCSTNSISSASSTTSNKSCNDTSLEMTATTSTTHPKREPTPPMDNQSMPLGCKRQRNWASANPSNKEDVENHRASPPPSHSQQSMELDQVLVENIVRQAGMDHNIDFNEMKGESKKLLTHYFGCPIKDTCLRCKFVVLSCSFMIVLMRSSRLQMIDCNPNDMPHPSSTAGDEINLTTNRRFG